jgi:excisionase family DNA binding protein
MNKSRPVPSARSRVNVCQICVKTRQKARLEELLPALWLKNRVGISPNSDPRSDPTPVLGLAGGFTRGLAFVHTTIAPRHDHLSFAPDAEERIQLVSLHAQRANILIILPNSESEMIFTPHWYTVAQVAQLLNYGASKVRMLIITGQLRSIKDGRSRRILPGVEAYVQDRAKSTESLIALDLILR